MTAEKLEESRVVLEERLQAWLQPKLRSDKPASFREAFSVDVYPTTPTKYGNDVAVITCYLCNPAEKLYLRRCRSGNFFVRSNFYRHVKTKHLDRLVPSECVGFPPIP